TAHRDLLSRRTVRQEIPLQTICLRSGVRALRALRFPCPSFSDAFRRGCRRQLGDCGRAIHVIHFFSSFRTCSFFRVALEAGSNPCHGPRIKTASKEPGATAALLRAHGFACRNTKPQADKAVTLSRRSACQRRTVAGRSSTRPRDKCMKKIKIA